MLTHKEPSNDNRWASPTPDPSILLREAVHRHGNDIQLVLGLLSLQARRVDQPEARQSLVDVIERVQIIAQSRASMQRGSSDLGRSLTSLCAALKAQTEPRGIHMACEFDDDIGPHDCNTVMVLTLIVNELCTNAIKHAFSHGSGVIHIWAWRDRYGNTHIIVDDDGSPIPVGDNRDGICTGLDLVEQLAHSIGATVDFPKGSSKAFRIFLPSAEPQAA